MTTESFQRSPLLTPERIAADPEAAFAILPSWVRSLSLIQPGDPEHSFPTVSPAAVVTLGQTHIASKTYSTTGLALLCELSRLPGVSVATDSNGKGRHYERITIAGAGEDLTSVNRILLGASIYEQAKVAGPIKSDMRPENLKTAPASRLGKDARAVIIGHAERISRDWEASGRMTDHFTRAEYLANLKRLLELTDLEATGRDLLDALPLVASSSTEDA